MKKLIEGILKFRKTRTKESQALFEKLARGQHPEVLFIGCSDSRVVPEIFASTSPGEVFLLRNVGNLVPPAASSRDSSAPAALEFATLSLQVSDIVVCGHSECGAMQALAEGADTPSCPHLKSWLKYGEDSLARLQEEGALDPSLSEHNQLSQINVLQQMEHIKSYPFIRERIERGDLSIHGWWLDIARADVYCYEPGPNQFILIDEELGRKLLKRLPES